MDIKFMRIKKIIIPVMAAIILVSQLTGCAVLSSNEMLEMIDQGQTIVLEVNQPSYSITIQGEEKVDVTWVQLDQLKTFNEGFRQGVDEVFNINTILDANSGIGGKQGCLYVVNVDGVEMRSGNTTIEDALRNKTFVNKYWNNAETRNALMDLAEKAYTDVDENSPYATEAVLNAYFNLLNDAENPDSFNPTQSVSREEFYTLLFKSTEGVHDLEYTPATDSFALAVGGDTEYTMYAKEVEDLGFLTIDNKSLDGTNIKGSISRAEAVYMLVQQNFPDLYENVNVKDKAFSDCKNAGDLALKQGFKEIVKHEQVNEETGKKDKWEETVEKERWQTYTLAYMFKNPDKGMQEELYKAMIVAKQVGIIDEAESRWDETLSKSEAIEMIVNTHLAKNNVYGYMTVGEYAEMEAPADYAGDIEVKDEGISGVVDFGGQFVDGIDIALADLTSTQIDIFKSVAHEFIDNVLNGEMTVSEMIDSQLFILDTYVMSNELPQNGAKLFGEWKASVNYYELLAEWLVNNGLSGVEDIMPSIPTDEEVNETQQQETVVTPQQNKPQPSENQQQTQVEDVQSKPLNPSQNIEEEGENTGYGTITKAEDAGNSHESTLIRAVAAAKGISYEEAKALVESGDF